MTRLTIHGKERLFERVLHKAQEKTSERAKNFIQKVLEKGVVTANDAQQMMIVYANNLYVFKKEGLNTVFITVKTCQEYRLGVYIRGTKKVFTSKKNFALCA